MKICSLHDDACVNFKYILKLCHNSYYEPGISIYYLNYKLTYLITN